MYFHFTGFIHLLNVTHWDGVWSSFLGKNPLDKLRETWPMPPSRLQWRPRHLPRMDDGDLQLPRGKSTWWQSAQREDSWWRHCNRSSLQFSGLHWWNRPGRCHHLRQMLLIAAVIGSPSLQFKALHRCSPTLFIAAVQRSSSLQLHGMEVTATVDIGEEQHQTDCTELMTARSQQTRSHRVVSRYTRTPHECI